MDSWLEELAELSCARTTARRRELLARLARAEHVHRRQQLAELLVAFVHDCNDLVEDILARLVEDDVAAVRSAAAEALAQMLEELPGLARVDLIARWAVSSRPLKRVAIAHALGGFCGVVGAPTALELLSRDPYADVRRAVAESAGARIGEGSGRYLTVLRRLARDDPRSVRLAALAGLRRAAELGLDQETPAAVG